MHPRQNCFHLVDIGRYQKQIFRLDIAMDQRTDIKRVVQKSKGGRSLLKDGQDILIVKVGLVARSVAGIANQLRCWKWRRWRGNFIIQPIGIGMPSELP
jgi:hypothetical protein